MTRRRRSEPVSGAIVIVRSPLSRQDPDDRLGQIVEPQRRRADGVAHLEEARENALDVRVIAERDRHEADAARVRSRALARELQDAIGGKRADRQVVVAGPAEAAQVRAAADDFDEEARAELGVGREDARRRRIDRVGRLQRGLAHRQRRVGARPQREAGQRAVGGVLRLVERRNVEAALGGEQAQQIGAIGRGAQRRGAAPGTSTSPSPAAITSANGASGSGLTNVTAPPMTISGWRVDAFGRVARNAGEPQQRQDVHVVPLERHREREDVEVADRRLRLERHAAAPWPPTARPAPASAAGRTRSQTMSSSALKRR